jgi:hypothetical protein
MRFMTSTSSTKPSGFGIRTGSNGHLPGLVPVVIMGGLTVNSGKESPICRASFKNLRTNSKSTFIKSRSERLQITRGGSSDRNDNSVLHSFGGLFGRPKKFHGHIRNVEAEHFPIKSGISDILYRRVRNPIHHSWYKNVSGVSEHKERPQPARTRPTGALILRVLSRVRSWPHGQLLTLRTGRESFPSSGSSRYKLRDSGASFHDGFLRVSGRWTPNFLKNARSSK